MNPETRNTTGWRFEVDRRVAGAGHGWCGGWHLAFTGDIYCLRCDVRLFAYEPVRP